MGTLHSKEKILQELSKLRPIKYNQFRWWRRWENKNPLLPKTKPLIDRILNGDFDFSHYFWQAQYVYIEMEEKKSVARDNLDWLEIITMDRARLKRLIDDFERDEKEKLEGLEKAFTQSFHLTKEDYRTYLEEFEGTIEELYHYINGKCFSKTSKRGRTRALKKDFLDKIF
jgi:hypothetical protein